MITINARNVRDAYAQGMALLRQQGVREESRAGPVLVLPCPVMTVYEKPCERVLVDQLRDQNCFFTLAEALWMLAGRRDADFLNRYVGDFGQRFAERNGRIHDAYGHRWRGHFGYDQLTCIVKRLRENPGDRQAVLSMWDPSPAAGADRPVPPPCIGANDLREKDLRTRPCNTHAYFRVRQTNFNKKQENYEDGILSQRWGPGYALDMTVCCRSNDMIFGGYGANAVHFSFLQEYLAARIGVGVGRYYQLSNNFHAYTDVLDKVCPPGYQPQADDYETPLVPLVTDPATFDDEVRALLAWVDAGKLDAAMYEKRSWTNAFIPDVALPLLHAHAMYRQGLYTLAAASALRIRAPDWERAAVEWLERRKVKREAREFARTREEMTDGRTVCHN